jgi:hypothetical protein
MQALLLVSLTITLTMALARGGRLAGTNRDGTSALLEWLSPVWDLWTSAPTYIFSAPATAWMQTLPWLLGALLIGWICRRSPSTTPGHAALRALSAGTLVVLSVTSLVHALPGAEQSPRFDPESRLYFPMLVDYDAEARPIAVRYDPLTVVAPSAIPPLFSLTAVPGQRTDRQPRQVLLNARFALPAGEYEVDLQGTAQSEELSTPTTVSLQVGREGAPLRTWPMRLSAARPWHQRFLLPVDSEFVGFVTSREVEAAVAALRLRPVSVVDAGRRVSTDAVLGAASWGPVTVFFHDTAFYAEPNGFWVRGWSSLRSTVMIQSDDDHGMTLRVHSGPAANTVTFATQYWSQVVDFLPGVPQTITVPATPGTRSVPLSVTTAAGFVPADLDADSTDPRRLGVWVEFSP